MGPVAVRFRPADADAAPEHWRTFGQRSSPLTSAPRSAVNPASDSERTARRLLTHLERLGQRVCREAAAA